MGDSLENVNNVNSLCFFYSSVNFCQVVTHARRNQTQMARLGLTPRAVKQPTTVFLCSLLIAYNMFVKKFASFYKNSNFWSFSKFCFSFQKLPFSFRTKINKNSAKLLFAQQKTELIIKTR